ncbi:MAG: hypothetical protein QOE33_3510 [Acidobacteriota bacterium]|nr:hypothetical protein [Acidobacteriota bacterium]
MNVLWLVEDSPNQLKRLESLLRDLEYEVHAFRNADELLEHISDLPTPDAIVMDLALKVTSNGFQAAEKIRALRPEISVEKFCFISGWKKQFSPLTPNAFADSEIIDKANWRLQDLQEALDHAINSQRTA